MRSPDAPRPQMAKVESRSHATEVPTTPEALRSGAAGRVPGAAEPAKRGGASPADTMRRLYSRGWYASAPLVRAGLYAFGVCAPAAMGAAIFRAVTRAGVSGFSGHVREILAVSIGDPQPWSMVATLDGVLAISFINLWVASREGNALPRLGWIATNYFWGTGAVGCVAQRMAQAHARADTPAQQAVCAQGAGGVARRLGALLDGPPRAGRQRRSLQKGGVSAVPSSCKARDADAMSAARTQ